MMDLGIPEGPSALTASWFSDCLTQVGVLEQGQVSAIRIERFAAGVGLLGLLVRVHLEYTAEGNGPRSLVVKFPAESAASLAVCEALGFYAREHNFYTHSARHSPLRTPRVYYSKIEGLTRFILVMEDIADRVAGDQTKGATPEQVRLGCVHIARHHAAFWGRGGSDEQSWVPALNAPQNVAVVQHITSLGMPRIMAELSECFTPELRAVTEQLVPKMPALANALCSGAMTLVHGDLRIDNLMFGTSGSDEIVVLDWQICYEACAPYDVAYMMTQSVPPAVRRQIEHDVLTQYHDTLRSCGIKDYDFAACKEDYRRATIFCLCYPFIALGALDLSNERSRTLGKMMLERALSAVADIDSLALISKL